MPHEVGAAPFWKAMIRYIRQDPASLDGILAELDANWPDDSCGYEPCCSRARRLISSGGTSSLCVWIHQWLPTGSSTPALRSP